MKLFLKKKMIKNTICKCQSLLYSSSIIYFKEYLITLDGLLGFTVGLVCMVKSNFKLIDVTLQFLLDPKKYSLILMINIQISHAFLNLYGMICI